MLLIFAILQSALCQEKYGKRISISETTGFNYDDWLAANRVHSTEITDDRNEDVSYHVLLKRSLEDTNSTFINSSFRAQLLEERKRIKQRLNSGDFFTHQRRLVEDLLDPEYYELNVHPRRDFLRPTRVNTSMSLYQILGVDEHLQSLTVNVWMVEEWFDEFLDWNPHDYGMLNKTIIPFDQVWTPDTYLYNSETLEQKRTEAMMNIMVETGYWRNDSRGARVHFMFPAIYKLSCAMDVRWFPYDSQNCSFIISSWTHDKSTIDYWPSEKVVNLKNMARNDEWVVLSFEVERIEQYFACCEQPWVMLYAHLVIRRKPLYYIINLVIPTSIITTVAITGFFTPTSSSCERDEKLYLGINTLLTMSIMMLMVCNQMPSTSTYVPLMSWYYIGIIFVIVIGTLMATIVLAIHGQKHHDLPIPNWIRQIVHNRVANGLIMDVPTALLELWTEFGIITEQRISNIDPLLLQKLDPITQLPPRPSMFFGSISSDLDDTSSFHYTKRMATLTRQYTAQVCVKDRERRSVLLGQSSHSRLVKRQKMSRRCALEWEFVANMIDRVLLTVFSGFTFLLFLVLVFFDIFIPYFDKWMYDKNV